MFLHHAYGTGLALLELGKHEVMVEQCVVGRYIQTARKRRTMASSGSKDLWAQGCKGTEKEDDVDATEKQSPEQARATTGITAWRESSGTILFKKDHHETTSVSTGPGGTIKTYTKEDCSTWQLRACRQRSRQKMATSSDTSTGTGFTTRS